MPKSNRSSQSSGRKFGRLLWLVSVGLVFLVAVAAVGFWFRGEMSAGATDIRNSVLSTVGLGVVPMLVWAVAFAATSLLRPRWLKHYTIWVGLAVLVIGITGVFAFFRPFFGVLGWFSIYGDVTLGGRVGEAVIGSANWLGTLRVFGVFILAIAVALPALALDVGRLLGQAGVFVYFGLFVALGSLFSSRRPAEPIEPGDGGEAWGSAAREDGLEWSRTADEQTRFGDTVDRYRTPEVSSFLIDSDYSDARVAAEAQPQPVARAVMDSEPERDVPPWDTDGPTEDEDLPVDPEEVPGLAALSDLLHTELRSQPRVNRFWSTEAEASLDARETTPAAVPPADSTNGTAQSHGDRNGAALLWQRPSIDLLREAPEISISEDELRDTAETITRTLGDYGVEVEVGHVRPGPTVTMYGLVPGWVRRTRVVRQTDADGQPLRDESGRQITKRVEQKTRVKVDSILAREKDLALALRTPSIRIETPAMGKSLVGIEVPNPNPTLVTLRSVMVSNDFQKLRMKSHLPIALGRGSGGEAVSFDLAKMPHLLVAGATGSGKSVCLNAIVSCLITERTPNEMRLLLVDPKRVELTPYNGIPHLMAPVVVETDTVVGYLKGLIREMNDRYRRMEEVGVRNIEAYNDRMPDRMPYLCVIVDELADLMMTAAFDVEQSLCRLAQLGRATGIHLIIATQRPSVDVVTGLIKANFPSRISFAVTSQVDSRTILDSAGADKLLGRGDMLYMPLDASKPSRVQNVFIGDDEIEKLVNFWKDTPWPAIRQIDLLGGEDEVEAFDSDADVSADRDDMMDKAIELALTHRKLSTSLLQRRLRIGYPRAARLMDQLEEEGVVGPSDGSKSRDVIINQS